FTDPGKLGNRYLFSFTINNNNEKHFQLFSDNTNNGMDNQRPLMMPLEEDEDKKVKSQDTIHVTMTCVDQPIYTYYNALLKLGGGVTPANPPSNINNGALGFFSAHTSDTKSIVIP